MKRVHIYLATGAIVVTLAATAIITQNGVSTAAPTYQAPRGIAHMQTVAVNLPNNVWVNMPLQVTLPVTGTYDLDADVRARLSAFNPPVNAYITARLWDATTNAVVPMSERLIYQIINPSPGVAGGNQTAPISELISVNGPTTIVLQARRVDAAGAANIAQIYSDANGYTSLRYQEIFP
jgi:hypothetical protein